MGDISTPPIPRALAGKVLVATGPTELDTRGPWRVLLSPHGSVQVDDVRSNKPVEALLRAATVASVPEPTQSLFGIYPESILNLPRSNAESRTQNPTRFEPGA